MRRLSGLILLLFLVFPACQPGESSGENETASMKGKKMIVYQMMTRLFGNKKEVNRKYGTVEENGVGTFEDVTDKALEEMKKLGATHIWYTGVLEHATMTAYPEYGLEADDADVVKGRAGSPYAIKDYYDVAPDLAVDKKHRMKEWEALIERTHRHGLGVIMDFVPNHVARMYHSDQKPEGIIDLGAEDDQNVAFSPQNNFYYLPGQAFQVPPDYDPLGPDIVGPGEDGFFDENPAKATGNNVFSPAPSIHDWFETVKLNYGIDFQNGMEKYFEPIPDTWIKMREILSFWAGKGVDYFRCDMAEMVPIEFWEWVIPSLKEQFPKLGFIAEIYQPALYRDFIYRGKFDYLYDKVGTYDAVRALIEGRGAASEVTGAIMEGQDIDPQLLRFLENHDEQRIASPQFAGSPWPGLPGMVVSALSGMGPVMIYFGQEVGEPGAGDEGFQGDDGRTTIFDYWGVPEHQKWMNGGLFDGGRLSNEQKRLREAYRSILTLARDSEAARFGTFVDLSPSVDVSDSLQGKWMAFARKSYGQTLFVFCNFSDGPMQITYRLPTGEDTALPGFRDALSGDPISTQGEILSLELPPFGYRILEW